MARKKKETRRRTGLTDIRERIDAVDAELHRLLNERAKLAVFFPDLEGHAEDPKVATVLGEIKQRSSLYRVLGSCPRSIL